jgi:benzodiazapine receptor
MERKRIDWIGNIGGFLLVIAVNTLANAIPLGGQTTGAVSAMYPSLFTPAGFTFSIWGIIYLTLAGFVIYQALPAQRTNEEIARIGDLFKANCLANATWIFAWHYDFLLLSLAVMIAILVTLIAIYRLLTREDSSVAPALDRWMIRLPFSLYLGWITVATIANISVIQTGMGWDNVGVDSVTWTLIKLSLAGAIGVSMVLKGSDWIIGLVVAWAAYGISIGQAASPGVAAAATTITILMVVISVTSMLRHVTSRVGSR